MAKGGRTVAVSALIAAAAGYVVGILTAPKSGKETRADIQKAALKAKSQSERQLKKLHSELSTLLDEGAGKAKRARGKAKSGLEEALETATRAKDKAREILSAVHEGDAEDKDLKVAIDEAKLAVKHLKQYLAKPPKAKSKDA